MKRLSIQVAELLYMICFLLYLTGSSLALIEHGTELSLWLMTLAVFITAASTILPWLGIHWLKIKKKGCPAGNRLAQLIRVASWGTFLYAMYLRLYRNLPHFYTAITLTTVLWAAWLMILLLSRHAYQPVQHDDKLIE